jgi:hypothetical protein
MAVRMLLYIAKIYDALLPEDDLYKAFTIPVPRPEFIVLYNENAPDPDESVLNLLDSFEDTAAFGLPAGSVPDLELRVKVYNINKGHNEALLRRSEALNGYAVFVAKVREYEAEIINGRERSLAKDERDAALTEAMTKAVKWCVANNVLKEFFKNASPEVINMLVAEWNWDKFVEVRDREAKEMAAKSREEGREEGIEKGKLETARKALAKGLPLDVISEITGFDIQTVQRM